MNFLRQSTALLRLNLGGLAARSGAVLTILIGVTCAVGVLVSMLAMGTGAHRQALGDVRDDVAVVVSRGSSDLDSSVSRDQATTVADLPGISLGSDGKPLIGYQSVVIMEGHRRGTGARVFFPLIGTSPTVTAMRPEIHFTEGRMFQPGLHELVASNPCVRTFTGFELGAERDVRGVDWSVVGHFDQGNSVQCQVLADVETLMTVFGRNAFTNVSVELKSPRDFDAFRTALEANPALNLEARRERDQVEGRFKGFKALLNFAAYFVGAIMAVGATLGANTVAEEARSTRSWMHGAASLRPCVQLASARGRSLPQPSWSRCCSPYRARCSEPHSPGSSSTAWRSAPSASAFSSRSRRSLLRSASYGRSQWAWPADCCRRCGRRECR